MADRAHPPTWPKVFRPCAGTPLVKGPVAVLSYPQGVGLLKPPAERPFYAGAAPLKNGFATVALPNVVFVILGC